MLMTKVIGTLIILALITIFYFFKLKKNERKKHRYIVPTAAGFALAVLPQTFIQQESLLSVISSISLCSVLLGVFWYTQKKKIDRADYKMKKEEQKKKKHR